MFVALAFALRNDLTESTFLQWCRINGKVYVGMEFLARFATWRETARYVREFNGNPASSYKLAVNKFATWTKSEIAGLLLGEARVETNPRVYETRQSESDPEPDPEPPEELDWREKSCVSKVKDQGQCAASWAFAAIASAETCFALKDRLVTLSEQNLIDCVARCAGCASGQADTGLCSIQATQDGWLMLESDYSYRGTKDKCKFDQRKAEEAGVRMDGVRYVHEDEMGMAFMCAERGALAAAMDGSQTDFAYYRGGVYDSDKCDWMHPNLEVAIVGYGKDATCGLDFWIVRNSWGANWGEEGYFRIARNRHGMCGINMHVCYALFDHPPPEGTH